MLTLYQKGQIQSELEGEVKHARLLVPQYPHLLVPGMNARWASYLHKGDNVFVEAAVKRNNQ